MDTVKMGKADWCQTDQAKLREMGYSWDNSGNVIAALIMTEDQKGDGGSFIT